MSRLVIPRSGRSVGMPASVRGGGGGGGGGIPAGSTPPIYSGTGSRVTTEVGINSMGAWQPGDVAITTYLVWGSGWGSAVPTGYSGTHDTDFSTEILWYASNVAGNTFICIAKHLQPDPVLTSTATLQFTSGGFASQQETRITRWRDTNFSGVQVLGDNGSDYWDAADGSVGDEAVTFVDDGTYFGGTFTPADQSIPANCDYAFALVANDNGPAPSGTGYTFYGSNTSSGVDRMRGQMHRDDGTDPNNQTSFVLDPYGTDNRFMVSPRIVIPGSE